MAGFLTTDYLVFLSSIGKSGEMCPPGGHVSLTLSGDDDAVGVDEEVVLQDVGDGHGGKLQMCSLGGNKLIRLSRDNGTVGVFNKAVADVGSHRLYSTSRSRSGGPSSRLDNPSSRSGSPSSRLGRPCSRSGSPSSSRVRDNSTVDMVGLGYGSNGVVETGGLVESSLGSGDGRRVSGNQGTVGVAHKVRPA